MSVFPELAYARCQPDVQPSVQRAPGCNRKAEYRQKPSIVPLRQRNRSGVGSLSQGLSPHITLGLLCNFSVECFDLICVCFLFEIFST